LNGREKNALANEKTDKKQFEHPTVLLVRHGKTDFNKGEGGGRLKGTKYDLPLNQEGKNEAVQDAARLKKWDIASVEHSPMARSKQTADILGKATGNPPKSNDSLRPWDVGYLSGQKRTDASSRIGYYINHPSRKVPEGESYGDFYDNFTSGLSKKMAQAKKTPGKAHVLVTHSCNVLAGDAMVNDHRPTPHTGSMPDTGRILAVEKGPTGHWRMNQNPNL